MKIWLSCSTKLQVFLVTNRTIQLPLVNPDPREHFPTVWILRIEKEVNCQSSMEHKQAARVKEMEDEQRNFLQMMDSSYPTILSETQMPLGQLSGREQNLEGPSVDPFRVTDLDNPYEQEKSNEGLSLQPNDIKLQQMHNLLEQRLKAVENKNTFQGLNPNDLNLVDRKSVV